LLFDLPYDLLRKFSVFTIFAYEFAFDSSSSAFSSAVISYSAALNLFHLSSAGVYDLALYEAPASPV
jgi:hypothetical protein